MLTSIRDTTDPVFARYDPESPVAGHIDRTYRNQKQLTNRVYEVYAGALLAAGPDGLARYYQELYEIIQHHPEMVEQIRTPVSRCAAGLANRLETVDGDQRRAAITQLETIQQAWHDLPQNHRRYVEYAVPVEE